MILGLTPLTFIHVLISLIGIAAGLVVLSGLLKGQRLSGWTAIFLLFTLATSLTGFLFPFTVFTPAIGTGIVAIIVMIPTLLARYAFRMSGSWRWVYVVGAVISQYLNVFVLVVRTFLKVPALNALAPNGSEPPFALAQGVVLILHIYVGYLAVRRFRPSASGGFVPA